MAAAVVKAAAKAAVKAVVPGGLASPAAAWIPACGGMDPMGGGMDPGMGGPGGPGGSPQFRQLNGYPAQGLGQGFVPRGFQTGNRFNVQPFSQQNFGVNRSFQRFNSLHARIRSITCPWTSVSRKSRP